MKRCDKSWLLFFKCNKPTVNHFVCDKHQKQAWAEYQAKRAKGRNCSECGTKIEYSFDVCESCCDDNGHEYDFDEGGTCLSCGNAEGYERMADMGDYMEDR